MLLLFFISFFRSCKISKKDIDCLQKWHSFQLQTVFLVLIIEIPPVCFSKFSAHFVALLYCGGKVFTSYLVFGITLDHDTVCYLNGIIRMPVAIYQHRFLIIPCEVFVGLTEIHNSLGKGIQSLFEQQGREIIVDFPVPL